MISFHPITLADKEWLQESLSVRSHRNCLYSVGCLLPWNLVYQSEVAQYAGCGILRSVSHEGSAYLFPFGNGDVHACLELLLQMCRNQKQPLVLIGLEEYERDLLNQWYPHQFDVTSRRSEWEYTYLVSRMTTLAGDLLQPKRNLIARFKDNPNWDYRPITPQNIADCYAIEQQWRAHQSTEAAVDAEAAVLTWALNHFFDLTYFGGILYLEGNPIAFNIGERLSSETVVIHFEKALAGIRGAYQMVFHQFMLTFGQGYTYVNREEDVGDAGLRHAKRSYGPDYMARRLVARQSSFVRATPSDRPSIIHLWQTAFGDDESYISFYLTHRLTDENMLVAWREGELVSMSSWLPMELNLNGQLVEAYYLYAVATLPQYRGRGIASEMIRYMQQNHVAIVVQPAEESLINYYQRLGFRLVSRQQTLTIKAESKQHSATLQLTPLSAKQYKKIRDKYYGGSHFVQWDESAIQYALAENQFCGGSAVKINDQLLLYRVYQSTLIVVDTTLSSVELQQVAPVLLHHFNCKELTYSSCLNVMVWQPEGQTPITQLQLSLHLG